MHEKAVDRPISAAGALVWTAAFLAVERLCIVLVETLRDSPLSDIVSFAACEVLATSIVAFGIVRVHAPESPLRRAFGARPIAIHHLLLSAATGLGLCPILSALDDRILARFPYDPDTVAGVEKILARGPHLALVLGLLVVMPVAQEVFFRGLLFGGVREASGAVQTLLVTAALFAVAPLDFQAMPSALVLGLAFGWLRGQSGSLFGPIVATLSFRAIDLVTILRGRDPNLDLTYSARWVAAGAVLALAALASIRPPKAASAALR